MTTSRLQHRVDVVHRDVKDGSANANELFENIHKALSEVVRAAPAPAEPIAAPVAVPAAPAAVVAPALAAAIAGPALVAVGVPPLDTALAASRANLEQLEASIADVWRAVPTPNGNVANGVAAPVTHAYDVIHAHLTVVEQLQANPLKLSQALQDPQLLQSHLTICSNKALGF